MTYSEKLKDPRWQKKRLQIMDRDGFTCQCCGDKETTLNIHHKKYNGDPWEASENDLMTVCEDCHYIIESAKGTDVLLEDLVIRKRTNELDNKVIWILDKPAKVIHITVKPFGTNEYTVVTSISEEGIEIFKDLISILESQK